MRVRVARFFAVAVAAVVAAQLLHPEVSAAQPSTPPAAEAPVLAGPTDAVELEAFLDGWLAAYLEKVPAAGATVSVVRDGKVLLAKGYGFADLEAEKPVEPDATLFRIGSVSKLFVWTSSSKESSSSTKTSTSTSPTSRFP
jgi:CubicO group peptidase (beta-lactamase class C family)